MFITDHTLNIVFNRMHSFQTYNDIMSAKKEYLVTKEQHLETRHENWLIINLSK